MLSASRGEARRNVLALYRAWYRELPFVVEAFQLDKSLAQCRTRVCDQKWFNFLLHVIALSSTVYALSGSCPKFLHVLIADEGAVSAQQGCDGRSSD